MGFDFVQTSHRWVYAFHAPDRSAPAFRLEALGAPDRFCEEGAPFDCEYAFVLAATPDPAAACGFLAPGAIGLEHRGNCPPDLAPPPGPLPLTGEQAAAFLPAPGAVSEHPYHEDVVAALQAIVTAAAAAYRLGGTGACEWPPEAGPTPPEGTCCADLGGPDSDGDGLCDTPAAHWTHPAWAAVGFALDTEQPFTYETRVSPDGRRYEARAFADLDCDYRRSMFAAFAVATDDPGCTAGAAGGLFVVREYE